MKDSSSIAVFAAVFAVLAFRIYQKYFKKNDIKGNQRKGSGSSFPSSSKDDDYEPYSKK
ncbi:MAG: hypothetical protein U0T33_00145 [Bacteroidales bacterium]